MPERIVRALEVGTSDELAQQHVRPFHLAKITFGEGMYFVSEGPEIVFGGDTYLEGRCELGQFTWTPDGQQEGEIRLLNDGNAASALALNNRVAGAPITVYLVYQKEDGSFTTPEVYAVGALDQAIIEPDQVVAEIKTTGAGTTFFPNRSYSQNNGFNYLPIPGMVVVWGDERYELEVDD